MTEKTNSRDSASNCDQFPRAVFESEADELKGTANTNVAMHIQECTECRPLAETIRECYALLDTALTGTVRVDARQIVVEGRERTRKWRLTTPVWFGKKPNYGWMLAGVATVTVLLAFMLGPLSHQELPPDHAQTNTRLIANASSPQVEQRNFAVIQTSNPNIKIYWFF